MRRGSGLFGFLLPSLLMMAVFFDQAVAASAFDFFGLFGFDEPPNPSATTLPYRVEFVIIGDDELKSALQESSNLYKLRQDPPQDGEALVQRLEADFSPMLDALWGFGYYNARIFASVGATQLELGQTEGERVARAAKRLSEPRRCPRDDHGGDGAAVQATQHRGLSAGVSRITCSSYSRVIRPRPLICARPMSGSSTIFAPSRTRWSRRRCRAQRSTTRS
jgi:hypothetical protein